MKSTNNKGAAMNIDNQMVIDAMHTFVDQQVKDGMTVDDAISTLPIDGNLLDVIRLGYHVSRRTPFGVAVLDQSFNKTYDCSAS
jgi:hypothetical protein